jgi:BolA family transcriptional regulator, general stress-responsive regulator
LNRASFFYYSRKANHYAGQTLILQPETLTTMGPIAKKMEAKLALAFAPLILSVIDESNQHHGHAGAHPSGESHFRVRISSAALVGKSRIQQHRAIHEVLADELQGRVHALAIEVLSP